MSVDTAKKYMSDAPMDPAQVDNIERILKWISIAALIIGGAIFIYEGSRYIKMKEKNPNLPSKLYGAGAAALVLGILSVAFGIIHIWW